jgi:hypothetical protein
MFNCTESRVREKTHLSHKKNDYGIFCRQSLAFINKCGIPWNANITMAKFFPNIHFFPFLLQFMNVYYNKCNFRKYLL